MKTSVIILSYNHFSETTGPCLASLANDPSFSQWDVLIVDNASDKATKKALLEAQVKHPSIRVIFNELNIGYAGGNNAGIKAATGTVIILLNSDTQIPLGTIDKLAARFNQNPKLGMVGPVTNSAGNGQSIWITDKTIDGIIKEGQLYANNCISDLIEIYRNDFHCVAISRDAIQATGLLDEGFGLGYYEDFDYSMRIKQCGYNSCIDEDTFVYHRGSVSFKKIPAEAKQLLKNNKKRLLKKHGKKITFEHARDGNIAILKKYIELKKSGISPSKHRFSRRIKYALKQRPKGWIKRLIYLIQIHRLAEQFGIKIKIHQNWKL
jgi:GT2 family glycosyltransferase